MKEIRFKHTDLGIIPLDWEATKLVNAFELGNGYTPSKDNPSFWSNGTIPWFRIEDIKTNGRILKDSIQHISETAVKGEVFPADSFIISTSATIGEYALLKCKSVSNQRFVYLIPKKGSTINNDFFLYHCHMLGDWCKKNTDAGSSFASVNMTAFKDYQIVHPSSITEQKEIAKALGDIDKLIASLEKLIEKKRMIKQGSMQQLLTGKIRLESFNQPWTNYKLSTIFEFGNGYTPSKAIKEYWTNGTIPWFRMEDIRINGRILKDSIQKVTPSAIKGSGLFPAESFILSTTATIGEHALLIADSLANQRFTFLWNVNRRIPYDTMFFYHYLFIIGDWCRKNINEGGLQAVNMEDLKNFECFIPSDVEEQRAIGKFLTDMDAEISALEKKLNKYKDIKRGMMQQLLTGKIRLL